MSKNGKDSPGVQRENPQDLDTMTGILEVYYPLWSTTSQKALDKLPVIPLIVARSTTSEQNINESAEISNGGSEVTVSTQITRQSQR